MSRARLIEMTQHAMSHAHAGTIDQEPDVLKIPAANYYDQQRFETEVKQIFRRMPLVLAPSAELPNPGDYKAMDAAGMPVLLCRDRDGDVRAFVNSCSHRGTAVALDGTGNVARRSPVAASWIQARSRTAMKSFSSLTHQLLLSLGIFTRRRSGISRLHKTWPL